MYSIHQVQHIPSTASTHDYLSSHCFHDYVLTPELSFSFRHASLYNRPLSAIIPWAPKGKVTLSHSHGCELTNWWIESQHPVHRPWTASMYMYELTRLRPPFSHDHGLQVHLQHPSMTASKCISKLAPLQLPSVCRNLLDYFLGVHL
jgi:hypothetical protein